MNEVLRQLLLDELDIQIKLMNNPYFKARAVLDFKIFKIKGFVIRTKEGGENWVNPPSIPTKAGKYLKVFFSEDKDFWNEIQKRILEKYDEALMSESITGLDEKVKILPS